MTESVLSKVLPTQAVQGIKRSVDKSNVRTDLEVRKGVYRLLISLLKRDKSPGEACLELYTNIRAERPKDRAGIAFGEWYRGMESGQVLSDAMHGWLPEAELMQIRAGEAAGNIREGIESALKTAETSETIAGLLKTASFEPVILILIAYGILYVAANHLMPTVGEIVDVWPEEALPFKNFAEFFAANSIFITIGLVGAMFGLFYTLPVFTGPVRTALDHLIAPWTIHRQLSAAAFMRGFAGLLQRDQSPLAALTTLKSTSTPYVSSHIDTMLTELSSHGRINEALVSSSFFSERQNILFRVTAGDGDFARNIREMAGEQLDDVTRSVEAFSRWFRLGAMAGVGVILLWAFGSMLTAVMQFYNEVSTNVY